MARALLRPLERADVPEELLDLSLGLGLDQRLFFGIRKSVWNYKFELALDLVHGIPRSICVSSLLNVTSMAATPDTSRTAALANRSTGNGLLLLQLWSRWAARFLTHLTPSKFRDFTRERVCDADIAPDLGKSAQLLVVSDAFDVFKTVVPEMKWLSQALTS